MYAARSSTLATRSVRPGRLRIPTEPDRAVLVRHPRQRDALAEVEVAREEALVALVPVDRALRLRLHQALELGGETSVALLVVGPIREHDVALTVEGHAVVRIGQVLGGEPEVERVPGHEIEGEARRDGGRAPPERVAR